LAGPKPPRGSIAFYYLRDATQFADAEEVCAESAEFHLCLETPASSFSGGPAGRLDKLIAASTRLIGKEDQAVAGDTDMSALAPLFFRGAVLLRAQELDIAPQNLPSLDACLPAGPVALRALLCADAKGYSRLDNRLLAVFVRDYLGCIGRVVEQFRNRTLTVKTAGDGLFIVFRDLASAVHFSLDLLDATCAVDWAAKGMPEDLGLRISLDAGPMLEFTDPPRKPKMRRILSGRLPTTAGYYRVTKTTKMRVRARRTSSHASRKHRATSRQVTVCSTSSTT
jgi:hypothetical protein